MRTLLVSACGLLANPVTAWAHAQREGHGSFLTGFAHPITGVDHALAMFAVGLWGAQLGGSAIWVLPIAFPLVMALGAAAGVLGLPMVPIELGIALSVMALGLAIAARARPPLAVAGALVALFAIVHGYAHGAEMPRQSDAMSYGVGFVIATGLIHLLGIGLGMAVKRPRGDTGLRLVGAAVAASGVLFAARSWMVDP